VIVGLIRASPFWSKWRNRSGHLAIRHQSPCRCLWWQVCWISRLGRFVLIRRKRSGCSIDSTATVHVKVGPVQMMRPSLLQLVASSSWRPGCGHSSLFAFSLPSVLGSTRRALLRLSFLA